jgi:hypothetical protein
VFTPYRSTYLDFPQSTDPGERTGQPGGVVTMSDAYHQPIPDHPAVLGSQVRGLPIPDHARLRGGRVPTRYAPCTYRRSSVP